MLTFLQDLGLKAKIIREHFGLTQKQVAEMYNTSIEQVSRFENGKHFNNMLANKYFVEGLDHEVQL